MDTCGLPNFPDLNNTATGWGNSAMPHPHPRGRLQGGCRSGGQAFGRFQGSRRRRRRSCQQPGGALGCPHRLVGQQLRHDSLGGHFRRQQRSAKRRAALLDVAQISEITEVVSATPSSGRSMPATPSRRSVHRCQEGHHRAHRFFRLRGGRWFSSRTRCSRRIVRS